MFDYRSFVASFGIILAPLAGVSDVAFRQICIEHGAQLTFTEMVSAKGLSYANDKTVHLMDLAPNEALVGVQLFGHEPETMASQAAWIEDHLGSRLAVIDINMGCPARKIVSKGDGCALMKDLPLAQRIVSAVTNAVSTPVTVKMRRAYDIGPDTAPELAKRVEDAGATAVTVHGRYATQMYRGASCWDCITDVKRAVKIPVIGNGDIRCGSDAVQMVRQTGCNSVMVARGAQGNPWIFEEILHAFAQEGLLDSTSVSFGFQPASAHDRIDAARRQTSILHERDPKSVVRMRKHASWYVKGLPGASAARAALNACTTKEDFLNVYSQLELALAHCEANNASVESATAFCISTD